MVVSAKSFEQLALAEPDRHWELDHGRLREKPPMSVEHNTAIIRLGHQLLDQLDVREFEVRINMAYMQRATETYYIPDIFVVPAELPAALRGRRGPEMYGEPMPLVVEVWSPSTGAYDVDAKIPEYQQRGDLEIWRIHPYDKTLIAWRRQDDGSYAQAIYREGIIEPVALPNVKIDLAMLFS